MFLFIIVDSTLCSTFISFIKNIDNVSHTINELPDHGDHLHFNMSNLDFFSLFYQLFPAIVAKIELDDNISKKQ